MMASLSHHQQYETEGPQEEEASIWLAEAEAVEGGEDDEAEETE